jgi:hypothetical protein
MKAKEIDAFRHLNGADSHAQTFNLVLSFLTVQPKGEALHSFLFSDKIKHACSTTETKHFSGTKLR